MKPRALVIQIIRSLIRLAVAARREGTAASWLVYRTHLSAARVVAIHARCRGVL